MSGGAVLSVQAEFCKVEWLSFADGSHNTGTQRGKMTRIHSRLKCEKCPRHIKGIQLYSDSDIAEEVR